MRLQATIGRQDNSSIRGSADYLGIILSNSGCVPDKGLEAPSVINFSDYLLYYTPSGEAVIKVRDLTNPQALYRALSKKGFTLVNSKLTRD